MSVPFIKTDLVRNGKDGGNSVGPFSCETHEFRFCRQVLRTVLALRKNAAASNSNEYKGQNQFSMFTSRKVL